MICDYILKKDRQKQGSPQRCKERRENQKDLKAKAIDSDFVYIRDNTIDGESNLGKL